VSNDLVEAAQVIAPERNKDWRHEQQALLLHNQVSQVLHTLKPHREPASQQEAPIQGA
jgi:hypothetical protein